ncbi:hypothetical protein SUDANB106_00003 [Streptomyces sp. enrichment culture]|uniref:hypothetical protein n=1 Tax=Streptomyces sp. enrichment culture TaxID=1795815 RepID=UPI003F5779CD
MAAVKTAESELARAKRELEACEQALGGRRPLPVVRAAVEDGVPLAALTAEEVRTDVAAEVQRYAVDRLKRRARQRSYDLVESLVQESQRESTVVVLQRTPVIDRDGSRRDIWRGQQVTGANRADARLDIFGVSAQHLLAGVPQYLLQLPGEEENRRMVVQGLGEILRRISTRLNAVYADPERDPEGHAERALRIAQVPARVVVGARKPERLEESLRQLNVHEHLRGQLDYDNMDRALGLWSTLVKAYQAKGLLGALLAQEVAQGRIAASALDEDAVADALVGARALDDLKVLLSPGDEVSPMTLRDVAIRCATVMVFPPIPPRPQNLPPRARMPVGPYCRTGPVVRRTSRRAPGCPSVPLAGGARRPAGSLEPVERGQGRPAHGDVGGRGRPALRQPRSPARRPRSVQCPPRAVRGAAGCAQHRLPADCLPPGRRRRLGDAGAPAHAARPDQRPGAVRHRRSGIRAEC